MNKYKVRYGASVATIERSRMTVGQLKADSELRARLGYGDNVNALYNGVPLGDSQEAPAFIESPMALSDPYAGAVVMETMVNTKQ